MTRNTPPPHGYDGENPEDQDLRDLDPGFAGAVHNLDERRPVAVGSPRPSNLQVGLWSVLGLGAIGYLSLSLFASDSLRSGARPADAGTARVEETRQEMATLSEEVTAIRQNIDSQNDVIRSSKERSEETALVVDDMRRQVAALNGSTRAIEERLQQMDGKSGKPTKAPVAGAAPAPQPVAAAAAPLDSGIDGLVIDEPTALVPKTVKKPAKPEAGQVAVAKPAKPAKAMGIELAMSTSPEALRLSWELLNEQHGGDLAGLQPKSAASGDNYRLLAGPFASPELANAACAKLAKRGLSCKPAPFVGSAL
jgi:SPOR domain